jgi:Ca2+/Na+ antiporter
MSNIFLGPVRYWLTLVITIIIIFLPGMIYMHVTNFNLFIFITFAITGILLAFVIKTYKKGTQVTREKW